MKRFSCSKSFLRYSVNSSTRRSIPIRVNTRVESKRSLSSMNRIQNNFQMARNALAYESSTLRYNNLLFSSSEESLVRGWDDDIIIDDDDGT